jgi:hypothetical protein
MGAFLGISLWVALATVVPGLITIACLFGALQVVNPRCIESLLAVPDNDWVWSGLAVTVMVLTQALGILLENFLVSSRRLGPEVVEIDIPKGIDPHHDTHVRLQPYFEYEGLYILLSELREDEDTQGHLKRSLAQFFLTNNTLVSYSLGIAFAIIFLVICPSWPAMQRCAGYTLIMALCLLLSYKVTTIRFGVMAKSLWATRRRRMPAPHALPDAK